jgi:hypothetical protein
MDFVNDFTKSDQKICPTPFVHASREKSGSRTTAQTNHVQSREKPPKITAALGCGKPAINADPF